MKLKQLYILLLLSTFSVGCTKLTFDDVTGDYYKTKHYFNPRFWKGPVRGYNGSDKLTLYEDSTYEYYYLACLTSQHTIGRWEVKQNKLILHPYSLKDSSSYVIGKQIDSINGYKIIVEDLNGVPITFASVNYYIGDSTFMTNTDEYGTLEIKTNDKLDSISIISFMRESVTYSISDTSNNFFKVILKPNQSTNHIIIKKVRYHKEKIIIRHTKGVIRVKKLKQ